MIRKKNRKRLGIFHRKGWHHVTETCAVPRKGGVVL